MRYPTSARCRATRAAGHRPQGGQRGQCVGGIETQLDKANRVEGPLAAGRRSKRLVAIQFVKLSHDQARREGRNVQFVFGACALPEEAGCATPPFGVEPKNGVSVCGPMPCIE
jgi:hypothetical protein